MFPHLISFNMKDKIFYPYSFILPVSVCFIFACMVYYRQNVKSATIDDCFFVEDYTVFNIYIIYV